MLELFPSSNEFCVQPRDLVIKNSKIKAEHFVAESDFNIYLLRGYKRFPKFFQTNNGCTEENYGGEKLKLLSGNFKIRGES